MAIWLLEGVKQQMTDGLDPTTECLSVTWEPLKNRFHGLIPELKIWISWSRTSRDLCFEKVPQVILAESLHRLASGKHLSDGVCESFFQFWDSVEELKLEPRSLIQHTVHWLHCLTSGAVAHSWRVSWGWSCRVKVQAVGQGSPECAAEGCCWPVCVS